MESHVHITRYEILVILKTKELNTLSSTSLQKPFACGIFVGQNICLIVISLNCITSFFLQKFKMNCETKYYS